jgi:4-hydroxybenzoate polyprenyltransferase
MTLLQFAIGASNDVVDAPADRGRHDKPVAAGLVARRVAALVALICGAAGLTLAAISGPVVFGLAVAGLGLGLAYDVRLKRTSMAWLPFAIGIPLLVLFAWYGATGELTAPAIVVMPAGALAGTALALGNALVDPGADRAAGLVTPVVALGADRAWRIAAVLLSATVLVVAGSLVQLGATAGTVVGALAAGLLAAAGLWLARDRQRAVRERGWELEAVGIALLGAVWMAGVVATAR